MSTRQKRFDQYGFTTTANDDYFTRVVLEARPTTDFIVVHDKNTVTGENNIIILVRRSILNVADENQSLALGPFLLADWLEESLRIDDGTPFVADVFLVDNPKKALNVTRQQIKRIKNTLEGKVIKVSVESF